MTLCRIADVFFLRLRTPALSRGVNEEERTRLSAITESMAITDIDGGDHQKVTERPCGHLRTLHVKPAPPFVDHPNAEQRASNATQCRYSVLCLPCSYFTTWT